MRVPSPLPAVSFLTDRKETALMMVRVSLDLLLFDVGVPERERESCKVDKSKKRARSAWREVNLTY